MKTGLFKPALDKLRADRIVVVRPRGMKASQVPPGLGSAPSNQKVIDACVAAYEGHTDAVDQTTLGGVAASGAPDLGNDITAMHHYAWSSRVPPTSLAQPVLNDATMASSRQAVQEDGAFATFFIGIEASADVIVGVEGGVGVGFPFPGEYAPIWMAWDGLRIATNIDVAINVNAGIFIEPPSDIAGDYIALEVSMEPVEEGPEVTMGIHMSPDLSRIRGFSFGVGVALSLIPVSGAIVSGTLSTGQLPPIPRIA